MLYPQKKPEVCRVDIANVWNESIYRWTDLDSTVSSWKLDIVDKTKSSKE